MTGTENEIFQISSRQSASEESFASDGSSMFQTRKCWRWQEQIPAISGEVRRNRWCWIGHVLSKEVNSHCVALGWKPEGKRSRGRPKTTWCRTEEKERDRQGWRTWARARQGEAANNHQQ